MRSGSERAIVSDGGRGAPIAQAVLDSLTSHVAVIDRDGVITAVNRAWNSFARENGDANLVGTGAGTNYLGVLRTSAENGSEDALAALRGISDVMESRKTDFSLEYPCFAPDTPRWFSMHATPLDGGGVVVSHTNITERKLAELKVEEALNREAAARLRTEAAERVLAAVVENVPVGIILVSSTGEIVLLNSAGRQIVGMQFNELPLSAHNINQWPLYSTDSGEPIGIHDQPLARALRGETVTGCESIVNRLDGSGQARIQESAVPLLDATDTVGGAVAVFADVTEERDLEDQRESFISNAAHDLKGPLTTIKGFAQLLRRQVERNGQLTGERAIETLNQIDRTATRLATQVSELQDVASIRTGKPLRLTLTETHVVALVRRVVAQYRESDESHRFELDLPADEIHARWDASRIERVLQNLLQNAVKYSAGGTEIVVRVRQDGEDVVIEVADHGIGIPARDLPHVFERYFRGSNVTERVGGTGIGLAGVYQIATQHGGEATVESREGQGTTFTIRLPREAPEDEGGF